MRNALKSLDDTRNGKPIDLRFGRDELLLDPAGVLIIKSMNMLVVSDLHLEKGSSFARRGQFLPPYDTGATLQRLEALVDKYAPEKIVSLGDSFHDEFASERLDNAALVQIEEICAGRDMIWVTGNHDPSPPSHVPGTCVEEIALGDIALRHIPQIGCSGYEIAGHLHPCAKINLRGKTVRRACFASDGKRIIMPSFGVLTGGLNLGDPPFKGLFEVGSLCAFMMGRDQIYPVPAKNLVGV